jgi:Ribbon-helix-helix protein
MAVKDAGVRIRVEKGLHDQFLEICRRQDKPAAQVLRQFMRQYVAEHGDGAESPLPGTKTPTTAKGSKS